MKSPVVMTIADCIEHLDQFDAILDARSPSEFQLDHLPGAVSAPVLDDEQRAAIGTLYKQVSAFDAKRRGAALVARNIANYIDSLPDGLTREWRPLVYCWRGGNRSGALATVLARIGFRTTVIDGGYREYRRQVVSDLAVLPERLHFRVLAGRTGSGKSLVLQRLSAIGAQVLDLEALACHRGSVLGREPDAPQPAQKQFESLVWNQLRHFDPARPVYVESESKKIGQIHVPDALIARVRASDCLLMETPDDVRATLLRNEYRHFIAEPQALHQQLDCLLDLHGRVRIDEWKQLTEQGRWDEFIVTMMHQHYDPAYDRSMKRNFQRLAQAQNHVLSGYDPVSLDRLARAILDTEATQPG